MNLHKNITFRSPRGTGKTFLSGNFTKRRTRECYPRNPAKGSEPPIANPEISKKNTKRQEKLQFSKNLNRTRKNGEDRLRPRENQRIQIKIRAKKLSFNSRSATLPPAMSLSAHPPVPAEPDPQATLLGPHRSAS